MLVRLWITSRVLSVRERAAETTGGTAVEYSLLPAQIAAVIVVVVAVLGKVSNSFQSFNGQFTPELDMPAPRADPLYSVEVPAGSTPEASSSTTCSSSQLR